jgi:NAD(P)-dependent dehydrogenase (short-subunit alcohol dehydrogenase family)
VANVLDEFRLSGKVAMVTGAGSGLGAAFARALAEAGADVACVDLRPETAEETAASLRELGRRAIAVGADVSSEADAIAMVKTTVEELGGLDIAFANAGIGGTADPLLESRLETWQKTIDVDLTSVYLTAREVARVMVPRNRGKIINTASILGFVANPRRGRGRAYVSAKAGVVNLTRSLALDHGGDGVRISCVCPGLIDTPMADWITSRPDALREFEESVPARRIGTVGDIAGAVSFLASDAASYAHGTVLVVDGGVTA